MLQDFIPTLWERMEASYMLNSLVSGSIIVVRLAGIPIDIWPVLEGNAIV